MCKEMGKFDFCTNLKSTRPMEHRIQQKSRSQQLQKEKCHKRSNGRAQKKGEDPLDFYTHLKPARLVEQYTKRNRKLLYRTLSSCPRIHKSEPKK